MLSGVDLRSWREDAVCRGRGGNMSTVHVRARTAQIAALPGRRSSLSRYPCRSQYSSAEIDRAIRRGGGRWWQRPAGRPASFENRRETGSLRRPVHTTRFALAIFPSPAAIPRDPTRLHEAGRSPIIAASSFNSEPLYKCTRGTRHCPRAVGPAPTCH